MHYARAASIVTDVELPQARTWRAAQLSQMPPLPQNKQGEKCSGDSKSSPFATSTAVGGANSNTAGAVGTGAGAGAGAGASTAGTAGAGADVGAGKSSGNSAPRGKHDLVDVRQWGWSHLRPQFTALLTP